MTLAVRVLGGVCIVGACFLALPPPADTETVKWREVFRKGQVHLVPVGDADGHFIGLAHQRGLALFGSGEVARILVRFTFDGTREKTEYQGYGLYAFKDGSRVFVRFQGHGIKPTEQEGTLSFLRGTGRFKRIEGGAMWTAVPLPPFSSGARKSVSVTANIRCPPADSCPASLPAFVDPDPPPMEGDLSLGGLPGRASLDLLPGALGPKRDDIPTRADPPEAEDPRRDGTNGMDQ
jgi:hypothetical protein